MTWLLIAACAEPAEDTGPAPEDTEDSAPPDSGEDTGRAEDSGSEGEVYGELSGDCGVLDVDVLTGGFSSAWNTLDFGDAAYDPALLSEGAREVLADGNAGGSSLESEAISYEVLFRCEGAELLATETEVAYVDEGGKKIDLLVEVAGLSLGVSVTRAYGYPPEDPWTVDQAEELLADKLEDLQAIEDNVEGEHAFEARALHVLAYAPEHADSLEAALGRLDGATLGEATLVVTVTEGEDAFLY